MLINSTMPAAATLAALALSSFACAADVGPDSAIRGSLGTSIADLSLDSGAGTLMFLLNVGCVVFFAAVAIVATRSKPRRSQHIPFRSRTFAR